MRPKKFRLITSIPRAICYEPNRKSVNKSESVYLALDEFEAMRLSHLEGYDQAKIAKQMKIHQSTISRMLSSAYKKITDALVNIKAIRIEGGCYKIIGGSRK